MTTHDDLVQAFDDWAENAGRGGTVDVAVRLRRGGLSTDQWSMTDLLYELSDDPEALPDRVAHALGLPEGTSYAQAARILWASVGIPPTAAAG